MNKLTLNDPAIKFDVYLLSKLITLSSKFVVSQGGIQRADVRWFLIALVHFWEIKWAQNEGLHTRSIHHFNEIFTLRWWPYKLFFKVTLILVQIHLSISQWKKYLRSIRSLFLSQCPDRHSLSTNIVTYLHHTCMWQCFQLSCNREWRRKNFLRIVVLHSQPL